jgi:hypothetical protein
MILYVNGDSHSEGYDAVDPGPNPEYSYGKILADKIGFEFVCDASAGCSNDSIIRRTQNYLNNNKPDLLIIGWTTWERQEWEYQGKYYNVTGSGFDQLPQPLHNKYKQFVIDSASSDMQWQLENKNYEKIVSLHENLKIKQIPHLFFNCYSHFFYRTQHSQSKKDWGYSYIDPYNQNFTYFYWLKQKGFAPSNPQFYHYGADAHRAWAEFLLPKVQTILTQNG